MLHEAMAPPGQQAFCPLLSHAGNDTPNIPAVPPSTALAKPEKRTPFSLSRRPCQVCVNLEEVRVEKIK
jgi:hypothetical protein